MKKLLIAGAAAAAMLAMPQVGVAQMDDMDREAYMMTDAQEAMMMSWDEDKRIAYTQWPAAAQEYYWSLDGMQQEAWWLMTDDQRTRVLAMTPQGREQAWTAIRAQMGGAMPANGANTATAARTSATAPMATTATPVRTTTAAMGNVRYVSNATVQQIPPPHTGTYPLCNNGRTDNCINPREASRR